MLFNQVEQRTQYRYFQKILVANILFILLGSVGLWAMDGHESHSTMKKHSKVAHQNTGGAKRVKLDSTTVKDLHAVLKANEGLHWSFFKYDGAQAEAAAKELKKKITKIGDSKIANLLSFSGKKLDEIKASNSRDKNNQLYHLVSMALIHIVNKYDVGNRYNAYSCPMVKKQWVQNSSKIARVHNPYAPSMPHCGGQDTNY
jgi:hypothetical protein